MKDVLRSYDSRKGYITKDAVRSCMDILMDAVRSVTVEHDQGVFIDQDYVLDHYSSQISEFRRQYNALSDEDKDYAINFVINLSEYYKLRTLRDYFGVNVSF